MNPSRQALRLNVGFFINQSVGFSRDFLFDVPNVHLEPDLDSNDLAGTAHISRTAQGLLVQVKRATLHAECARCLANLEQLLEVDFPEHAFNDRSVSESGLILPEDGFIDLALLREYMFLAIPINPLCSPDCKGLCPVWRTDHGKAHIHDEEIIDSRLAKLKILLENQGIE
jgi:uncharacterized protein